MKTPALKCVIPAPVKVTLSGGTFQLKDLRTIHAAASLKKLSSEAQRICGSFGLQTKLISNSSADLKLQLQASLGKECWQLQVSAHGITITGGDPAGVFYALTALAQIIAAAASSGLRIAVIECGCIEDAPRFAWRSFMLDCSRHFQSKATVKAVIRLLAANRINTLHWHLTDNQGWRIGTGKVVPPESSRDIMDSGNYSKEDLLEIIAYAKENFIQIVPEVDVPGHSRSLLEAFPQYACDPKNPGSEFCIGNPAALTFLKKIYAEIFEIFADSKYIHFGGDEAETTHWEKCPKCQKAMKKGGFKTLRELENHFMVTLTRFAIENGKTPIVWGTGTPFPSDTVVQAWLDIREPMKHALGHGCKVIMSVHNSYYFDYPANPGEPQESWMFGLQPENIYMADPYVIWEEPMKKFTLGPEACLWTETIPEWRIMQKILPRIGAYAEVAWSLPEHKDWYDFLRRTEILRSAGYEDYLRKLSC